MPFLVGPLARLNNCFDQLRPTAKKAVESLRLNWPLYNNFQSIVVRMVELVHAFDEAAAIVQRLQGDLALSRVDYALRAGEGCHATEAPRGILYHRYRIGEDGLIAEAKIVPPTAQNQGQIEEDLKQFVPRFASLDDAALTGKCEQLIRNYDPCISCATHFLQLKIDRNVAG